MFHSCKNQVKNIITGVKVIAKADTKHNIKPLKCQACKNV